MHGCDLVWSGLDVVVCDVWCVVALYVRVWWCGTVLFRHIVRRSAMDLASQSPELQGNA